MKPHPEIRIARALERIADALDILVGNKTEENAEGPPSKKDDKHFKTVA